jgi:hypothetical protein
MRLYILLNRKLMDAHKLTLFDVLLLEMHPGAAQPAEALRPALLRSHTLQDQWAPLLSGAHCRLAHRMVARHGAAPEPWFLVWTDRGARGPGGCGEFASARR